MQRILTALGLLASLHLGAFEGDPKPECRTGFMLPKDGVLLATGGVGRKLAFQIDQSAADAGQVDVVVNVPDKPVILLLSAYGPTIWNVHWTPGTQIVGVFATGYHRQAVAGLPPDVPRLISTRDNKHPCGSLTFSVERATELGRVNPAARLLFGVPVTTLYKPNSEGWVFMGDALGKNARLITSPHTTPASFFDKAAPLAGRAALEEAVAQGLLRRATKADSDAWIAATEAPPLDVPPVAGQKAQRQGLPLHNAYAVLKPFTFPAGLYGANSAVFVVIKGGPRPTGNPGHSMIVDMNDLRCTGATKDWCRL